MEPTSRGFSEVRDVFFRELVEVSKNTLNGGGKDKLGEVSGPPDWTYQRGSQGPWGIVFGAKSSSLSVCL